MPELLGDNSAEVTPRTPESLALAFLEEQEASYTGLTAEEVVTTFLAERNASADPAEQLEPLFRLIKEVTLEELSLAERGRMKSVLVKQAPELMEGWEAGMDRQRTELSAREEEMQGRHRLIEAYFANKLAELGEDGRKIVRDSGAIDVEFEKAS